MQLVAFFSIYGLNKQDTKMSQVNRSSHGRLFFTCGYQRFCPDPGLNLRVVSWLSLDDEVVSGIDLLI